METALAQPRTYTHTVIAPSTSPTTLHRYSNLLFPTSTLATACPTHPHRRCRGKGGEFEIAAEDGDCESVDPGVSGWVCGQGEYVVIMYTCTTNREHSRSKSIGRTHPKPSSLNYMAKLIYGSNTNHETRSRVTIINLGSSHHQVMQTIPFPYPEVPAHLQNAAESGSAGIR